MNQLFQKAYESKKQIELWLLAFDDFQNVLYVLIKPFVDALSKVIAASFLSLAAT